MTALPYRIALASRGAGAFSYSYLGPAGMGRGSLAAVRFRHRLEFGLVLDEDQAPPDGVELQPLLPMECSVPGWGGLLLELCELASAAPYELLARLSLTGAAAGLKLSLTVNALPEGAGSAMSSLLACAGPLTPAKRKTLAKAEPWALAVELAAQGRLTLHLDFAGQPGVTSAKAAWRHNYELTTEQQAALGLHHHSPGAWPGGFLAGLAQPPALRDFNRSKQVADWTVPVNTPLLVWDDHAWPATWDVCQRWPGIARLPLRRTQCTLPELRSPGGLYAEFAQAVSAGQSLLLIAPQAWLLDNLWPLWAGLAPWLLRHSAAMPAGELAQLLHTAASGQGCVIAGTEAAWRLAAYARFDRVVLLDPSHPQWQPEGAPWLDPRGALLLACARQGTALDVVELGLSAFDGRLSTELSIYAPYEPDSQAGAAPGGEADTNPLPLKLREPDKRRLVYFNRLGSSRSLSCFECSASVACPQCRGRAIHYSRASRSYRCPDCGFDERDLRCPRCGLATLAARLPGLEAVRVRPGELLVGGPHPALPGPESSAVLGTAQLLEPPPGFWPEQIAYVDAEERDLVDSDWRGALDMAVRLAALYANPELAQVCIVSARLADRLPAQLTTAAAQQAAQQEDRLRHLGGLPPYAALYRLRALADNAAPLHSARELLGQVLSAHSGSAMLRLGKPFARQRRWELHGYLLNPQLSWPELQELRWQVHALGATLGIRTQRGPWL